MRAIKTVAKYSKMPKKNHRSRFVLLITLVLYFLCFITVTRCMYLADNSIGHRDEKGITSLG